MDYSSIQQIELTYDDALAVFSNEAFFEFASKIDFTPADQGEHYRTPPPQPATMPTSTCGACQLNQHNSNVPLQQPGEVPPPVFNPICQVSTMRAPLMRTLRNKLVWTEPLHNKFLEALDYFGIDDGESPRPSSETTMTP